VLADPAACRVLLLLWKKEFPTELNGKTYRDMTISDSSSVRALQVFRNVVLSLWHAYSSPESQPSRLHPFETEEDLIARELRIRELVGIALGSRITPTMTQSLSRSITGPIKSQPPKPAANRQSFSFLKKKPEPQGTLVGSVVMDGVASTTPQALSSSQQQVAVKKEAEVKEHLYTPFNARELMWTKPVLNR
jgi:hypothetical protein